jgi:hypothetical protein
MSGMQERKTTRVSNETLVPEVEVTTGGETHESLSIIVYGESKAGKSTFANKVPAPRLIMDSEMAYKFLPAKGGRVFWDPQNEAPPVADGSWETCVVITREYSDMQKAYEWLKAGQHGFKSLVIDSISELQGRMKDDLINSGRMTQQLWGDLLYEMDKLVRGFRDLTEHKINPFQVVVLTAMAHQKDGKWRPYVQGQLSAKLPYFLDLIGYLYVDHVAVDPQDPTKGTKKVRKMLVEPHDLFLCGGRTEGHIPNPLPEPDPSKILRDVFASINAAN